MENNKFKLTFLSLSENELFARNVIALFALKLNPSISELSDIKTAVSEAVTNCIVHAYPNSAGEIILDCEIIDNTLHINVCDNGVGIEDVNKAQEPFFTTKPEDERSGMGFTIINSFMDKMSINSNLNGGTKVYMAKTIKAEN